MDVDVVELTIERCQSGFASGAFHLRVAHGGLFRTRRGFQPDLQCDRLHERAGRGRRARVRCAPPRGPGAGAARRVPVVVKDAMDMAGFPTTDGWALLYSKFGGIDLLPERDAPVVARMRSAGAIILGKTNVPILSLSGTHANNSWAGPTYNAAARAFAPGASSAGTATAVAAGFAVAGLAEETGGSIQNPAGAQALVGIKPSAGLVPNTGVFPLSSNRDVVGPIARTVTDAAHVLDALAGYTIEDPKTMACIGHLPAGGYAAGLVPGSLRNRRLGLYGPGWNVRPLAESVASAYGTAQHELATCGAELVEDPFAGSGFAEIFPTGYFDPRGLESIPYDIEQYLRRLGPAAALRSFAEFAAATATSDPFAPGGPLAFLRGLPDFERCLARPAEPPGLPEFVAAKTRYLEIFARVMDAARIDALVFPQRRLRLPLLDSGKTIQETTVSEINISGLPAVVVPAGYAGDGAPFALIFVGRMWSERLLLELAFDYESHTRHRRTPALG